MSPIAAVLTGDLIASRQAGAQTTDRAMAVLAATAQDLERFADHPTRFTRFRGDGWQIVIANAGLVLRASLVILADLKGSGVGIGTRISAGVGPFDSLGTDDLSDATGRAFFVSGDHLDHMPRHRQLAIAGGRETDRSWQAAIFDLVDWQSRQWTAAQAQAVAMALRQTYRTQQDMADTLGITRQALQARLAGAGFSALDNALTAFEHLDWDGHRD